MNLIRLRPHHLLDIISSYGSGADLEAKHPWGASVADVTRRVLADIDQVAVMTAGVDAICTTCSKLVEQTCTARLGDNLLMREYNDDLDARLFQRLHLDEGQPISIRACLRRVNEDLPGIVALFTRGDTAQRLTATERALQTLGV